MKTEAFFFTTLIDIRQSASIELIPDDGVTNMRQMKPELVSPACDRAKNNERIKALWQ